MTKATRNEDSGGYPRDDVSFGLTPEQTMALIRVLHNLPPANTALKALARGKPSWNADGDR